MEILWFLLFLCLYGVLLFGIPLITIYALARSRKFFSFVGANKYRMVARGETVVNVIHAVKGFHLDENKRFRKGEGISDPIEKMIGAHWIGPAPLYKIKEYIDWQWDEFARVSGGQGDSPEYRSVSRTKNVYEFFHQFTHSVDLTGIELGGNLGENIRAKMRVLATVWVLDPIKFHETNKDAVNVLYGRIKASVRGWSGNNDFNTIKKTLDSGAQPSDFTAALQSLNGIQIVNEDPQYDAPIQEDGIFNLLGIVIVQASMEDFGGEGAAVDALEAKNIALLQGEADVAKAEKAAEVAMIKARQDYETANLRAAAQRVYLEQTAGYYASLPGGSRMYVADKIASADSDIAYWVEAGADIKTTLPLIPAPSRPVVPDKDKGK
jgi:hypothetical protein